MQLTITHMAALASDLPFIKEPDTQALSYEEADQQTVTALEEYLDIQRKTRPLTVRIAWERAKTNA